MKFRLHEKGDGWARRESQIETAVGAGGGLILPVLTRWQRQKTRKELVVCLAGTYTEEREGTGGCDFPRHLDRSECRENFEAA
jgi:hypothetical protein